MLHINPDNFSWNALGSSKVNIMGFKLKAIDGLH